MAFEADGILLGKHLGTGFEIDEQSKKVNVVQSSSGLDCAAIDQLPEVSWKKNTVVLAKQDGNCVRLKATGDISLT